MRAVAILDVSRFKVTTMVVKAIPAEAPSTTVVAA
jgi:hypothetical protein